MTIAIRVGQQVKVNPTTGIKNPDRNVRAPQRSVPKNLRVDIAIYVCPRNHQAHSLAA
jgi:hypothetical protein